MIFNIYNNNFLTEINLHIINYYYIFNNNNNIFCYVVSDFITSEI